MNSVSVIADILRWEEDAGQYILIFKPQPHQPGKIKFASVRFDDGQEAWVLDSEIMRINNGVLSAETLDEAVEETEQTGLEFYEKSVERYTDYFNRFREGLAFIRSIQNRGCNGCRWKAEGRFQKCTCCGRNRKLKDCYEKKEE